MNKTLKLSIAALFLGFSGMAAAALPVAQNDAISVAVTTAEVGPNIATEVRNTSANTIADGAFHAVEGINQVQQNNGANNAMQQGAAVAVNRDDDNAQPLDLSLAASVNLGGTVLNYSDVNGNMSDNTIAGDSFKDGAGISQAQQNNGNNNAMQQSTSVAVNQDIDDTAQMVVPPALSLAVGGSLGNTAYTSKSEQSNSISGEAFKGAAGISQVQQNNGSNSTMQQGAAVAVNESTAPFNMALAVAALGATVAGNQSYESGNTRTNEICGPAFSHVSGISQVQQNSGNNSMMQQAVAVSVNGGL